MPTATLASTFGAGQRAQWIARIFWYTHAKSKSGERGEKFHEKFHSAYGWIG